MKGIVLGAASGVALGVALIVRTTLRAPLFDAGTSGSEIHLLSSLPGVPWLVFAVSLLGLLGGFLGLRGKERLATPFLASGLAAGIFIPGAFSAAPFLAAFWGRFLDLILVISLLLVLGRLWAGTLSSWTPRALGPRAVGLSGLALYLGVGFAISHEVGLSGDEPHYLLVTESILKDGDIRVLNNYANEDYRQFYPGTIGPHLAAGRPYSVHGVLLSLLMLPGFALGGLTGVLLTEAVLAALLLLTVYRTASQLTRSSSLGLFAAAGFGLTAPGLFLGVSVYPEVSAALVVALASRRLLDAEPPGLASCVCWALLVGSLPFLHVKFTPLAAILIAALLWKYRRHPRSLYGLLAGMGAVALALLLFSYVTMGSLDPTASYGHQRIFIERVPIGVAGLLFDQEFGLLPSAPIYLLGLVGLVSLAHRNRLFGAVALLALLSVMLPGAAHPLWTGGNSPPARFLFPALPLLMVAASCLLAREREGELECEHERGVGVWAPFLLATSLAISGAMLFLPGQPLYLNARDGTGRVWEALSSSWDLTDYLPSLVRGDARSLVWASVLGLLLVLLVVLEWAHGFPGHRARRRFRLPHAAWFVLAAAWIQDQTGVSHSRSFGAHWVLQVMHSLSSHVEDGFVELPSISLLSSRDLLGRLALRLELDPEDGDPRHWWSQGYSLPAGRFELRGVDSNEAAFCNGESCFAEHQRELFSRVELSQFRLRTSGPNAGGVSLVLVAPGSSSIIALRTATLPGGLRLHGLDDEAYLDPSGFWVKPSTRAAFALEAPAPLSRSTPLRIRIANGGVSNRVVIRSPAATERIALSPWEEQDVALGGEGPLRLFTVESEKGFRPSELDPASRDHRELGVRLEAGRAFD